MSYRKLYIWVEGDDDERFVSSVLKPIFDKMYDYVKVVLYSKLKSSKVKCYIKVIEKMNSDYIFIGDINSFPCYSGKKDFLKKVFCNLNPDNIIIVKSEIESWYLSGIAPKHCNIIGIPNLAATNHVTKEKFISLIPKKFSSKIDFMNELLKYFSINIAIRKNESFKYFVNKYSSL